MKIYLAHQITGLTYDQVVTYYEGMRDALWEMGYEVLQPMTAKSYLKPTAANEVFRPGGYDAPMSTDHAIFERDRWMVSQADVVLVDIAGMDRVSIGCMMELAWASLLGKHTILVMTEDSPHQHAFVKEAADIIFQTLEEAVDYLNKLITQSI